MSRVHAAFRCLIMALVVALAGGWPALAQDVQISHDNALVAKLDRSKFQRPELYIWDVASGERRSIGPKRFIENGRVIESAFAFSPTAARLVIAGYGFKGDAGVEELSVWDTKTWKVVHRVRFEYPQANFSPFGVSLSISPDGRYLAYLSSPNTKNALVRLFDGDDFEREFSSSPAPTRIVGKIALLGRTKAAVLENFFDASTHVVRVIDPRTGKLESRLTGNCKPLETTLFAGTAVLNCLTGNRIQWVDLPKGTAFNEFVAGEAFGYVTATADPHLILGAGDRAVILNRGSGVEVRGFALRGTAFDGALSPDGSLFAAARFVRKSGEPRERDAIDLYDFASGTFLGTLH